MLDIRPIDWNDPRGDALRAAQQAEISGRYGGDTEPGPKPTASDMSVFFVAFDITTDDETPVGCGGLRALDDDHGEIKRMYVVPERRGSGVSVAVLAALEAEAKRRGWNRVVLETGDRQQDAIRFYEREGFSRIPNFGYYVDSEISECFEKKIT